MKQWYEALFENYGDKYDAECFAQGTVGECDFIEEEIGFNKKLKILDIGCGTGRHSIELAKRGYLVTGIDLSESLLSKAKEKAARLKLNITFEKCDARNLTYSNEFDVAIMLCEGAFPLMETDEMNYSILENAEKALKNKGGKFIFTTLNGLFPLFHSVKVFLASQVDDGNATYDKNTFDLMTFRDHSITTVTDDFGVKKQLECNERYYVPSEIEWMLKCLGFKKIDIYGAKQGAFSRADTLQTSDYEMLVIAEKQEALRMKSVEESAVVALDGTDKELFPYLPYILQDLWEIGSDPDVIIEALRKHKVKESALQLLDLGCGKGAVSIRVAEELGCKCFGIDAIEEFIREAEKKASEHGVDELCSFAVGDIRKMIDTAARYDIVVLGSIGPVFGDYYSTLTSTSRVLENDGIIIVDDGYIPSESDYTHPQILRRDAVLKQISDAGMRLIDEIIIQQEDIKSSDDYIFGKIENRCKELIRKYPDKRKLFDRYIEKQREENDVLENRIVCSTMIIKRQ